jgi:hypothetical protein
MRDCNQESSIVSEEFLRMRYIAKYLGEAVGLPTRADSVLTADFDNFKGLYAICEFKMEQ